jgi:hypothetical protein
MHPKAGCDPVTYSPDHACLPARSQLQRATAKTSGADIEYDLGLPASTEPRDSRFIVRPTIRLVARRNLKSKDERRA